MPQSLGHIRVLNDGPGDKLGKAGDIQQGQKGAFLGLGLVAIHIHRIGEHLKGVEGNADGQVPLCRRLLYAHKAIDGVD